MQHTSTTKQGTSRRGGFTAWETVVIVGLLLALVFLLMRLTVTDTPTDQRRLTINRLEAVADALAKYAIDNNGQFPTTKQGLAALLESPTDPPVPYNWRGPYLKNREVTNDAWGQEFAYVTPGPGDPPQPYDLKSLGADGVKGVHRQGLFSLAVTGRFVLHLFASLSRSAVAAPMRVATLGKFSVLKPSRRKRIRAASA